MKFSHPTLVATHNTLKETFQSVLIADSLMALIAHEVMCSSMDSDLRKAWEELAAERIK